MTENLEEDDRDVLPRGFELHWYEIRSVLGRGSFGITYLALDKNLDQLVAIKEYFPNDFSSRKSSYTVQPASGKSKEMYTWGLDRFIKEARILAKFRHINIVRVFSVFEHNNTAYMVMEYEHGEALSKLFKSSEKFSEDKLLAIFLPILEGLSLVHKAGFIHRDIKPSNIYIRTDGSPVLIDFGAARQVAGNQTQALTSLVTYGYAPFEQYNESEDKQGPWTDIYALGASLYFGLKGKLPIDALTRGSSLLSTKIDPYELLSLEGIEGFSEQFLRTIDQALIFHANERPQDILVWADMLRGKTEAPGLPASMGKQNSQAENEQTSVMPSTQSNVRQDDVSTASFNRVDGPANRVDQPALPKRNMRTKSTAIIVLAAVLLIAGSIKLIQEAEKPEIKTSVVQQPTISLLAEADEAFELGNYLQPKGKNAVHLYLQVLKIDPENIIASEKITEIVRLYSDGIRSDLENGNLEKAETNIQLLLAEVPVSPKLTKLYDDIEAAKLRQAQIAMLLREGQNHFHQNHLTTPKGENALESFRQVLVLDSNNQAALAGIEHIVAHYLIEMNKDLDNGKLDRAAESIDHIELIDPALPELKSLRLKLADQQAEQLQKEKLRKLRIKKQRIDNILSEAQVAFDNEKLISPPQDNAFYYYNQVLKVDPNNNDANSGINTVKSKLRLMFRQHISAKNFNAANSFVAAIENAMPRSIFAREMYTEWQSVKPAEKSNLQIVEDMIGIFKEKFEQRDKQALEKISVFKPGREGFLEQFFGNYNSFRLSIQSVQFIGAEEGGIADIKISDLVNVQGATVQPGSWREFQIEISKNKVGQWKVFW